MIHNVIFGARQCGKTYAAMTEIHDLIVLGRGREILVVFPELNYLWWWQREWEGRFPHAPMIDYVSVNSTQRLRGKFYGKVYVEDIHVYPDGIYDRRLVDLQIGLRSQYGDEEMVYLCSPHRLNARSHNRLTTKEQIVANRLAEAKYQRHLTLARVIAGNQEVPDEEG